MRFFDLLNLQHVVLYLFPALVFMLIFGLALGFVHFSGPKGEERQKKIYYVFPEDIAEKRAPFPAALALIVIGAALWAFFYILGYGLLEVRI